MKIDRDAARLEVVDEVEEVLLLLGRQARRRLVEDDDLGVVQHRAGDLDHLLLGRAEQAHHRRRVDVELQRLQELLRRDVDAAQAVEELLLAEKEVLRHRHRRHQAGFLEDHRHAEVQRLVRRARVDLAAVDQHLPRGEVDDAGHHLGEGRLAGAVLADDRVDLAGAQREVDAVDRRHAGVLLRRLAQLEDGRGDRGRVRRHDCRLRSAPATERRRILRQPLASTNRSPAHSTAATTPWCLPSKRLCSE